MNRTELEIILNKDRAWLLETLVEMDPDRRTRGVTTSEHDAAVLWSYQDHFVHLALIEHNFEAMVRRFLAGEPNPVRVGGQQAFADLSREQLMAAVHAMTEEWHQEHAGKSWDDVVAVTQEARGRTLTLISQLTDDQLQLKIPGAPWADGTIGGVLGAHAGHGRMHYKWAKDGEATRYHA